MTEPAAHPADPHDVRRVRCAPQPLRAFNDAGVLVAADVHVALRLMALVGETDPEVALALALAVRGPRLGHVHVDLATIRDQAIVDAEEPVELTALPWPQVAAWTAALARSALVAVGEDGAPDRPLRLLGCRLYLDRYWREERDVAADLASFSASAAEGVDVALLAGGLRRLFGSDADERQRLAAATATLRRLAVVAGGPGTGKTTTVARILALLCEQAGGQGAPPPLIALAAPTAVAAARLEHAVRGQAQTLDVREDVRAQLLALEASTLHRLLGWRPGSHSRFRHDRANRLAHDVVVVDETSMVSLSQMARLIEAVRPQARLILVGDPGQLRSIEAGAVLGDVVGPAANGLVMRPAARAALAAATGRDVAATPAPEGTSIGDGIVVLDRSHRFGAGIAALAEAVRGGDADATVALLRAGADDITWIAEDVGDAGGAPRDALALIRDAAVTAAETITRAAPAGDARTALERLGAFRLLCAHRSGPHGVAAWRARIEGWLASDLDGFAAQGAWYVGRPLLQTVNDYGLRLFNGDTGVVVAGEDGRAIAAFERGGEILRVRPARLGAVETVYAMTIHKAQGSQFRTAVVVLAPVTSPILTRELLYTAVTRAREKLVVAGSEDAVRAAVLRPVARASGLLERLWGANADS